MPDCTQCGAELEPDGLAGLCPQCLILGAFDTPLDGEESRTQTLNPASGEVNRDDFGRYQILRTLGEGGMGSVYLAEQREPIRRQVALKVIKLGMDTSQVLARFAIERQALALMTHPNIARILDAGATPKGRPFFVMEYIDGEPITQYCDKKRMTIPKRLEIFLAVCRAIQHAHQKGVIHRDLKPSNVLVMEQDGMAVPKVIDFGIAKATDQWAIENTLLTQFGQMVGTPEYASPEQAEVMTGEVDATSDVYSLGVLLFELLIGTVPFDAARMRHLRLIEMLRVIREEEADTVARKLSAMSPAAASTIAKRRATDVAPLRRAVEGDLSWITAKALEKSRGRRYSSVADLETDIQNHLNDQPVQASPPSQLYRARKFVRRHRTAVFSLTSGIALFALTAFMIWSLARRSPQPQPQLAAKGTIVLGDFTNATGDAAFNGLRQPVGFELEKSSDFNLLSEARVHQTLHYMERPADTKLTPDVASEVCERTGSTAAVDGSITQLGTDYSLSLRTRNCPTGDILDQEQASASRKEEVFRVLAQLTDRFRRSAPASLPAIPKEPSLPNEATTSSLEAWRSYSAAMRAQQTRGQTEEALQLFKRAIEIDPEFASAYANLGRLYASLGESELGAQNIATAYELRKRVSDLENFQITFNYHRQVTRNLEVARQTLESWIHEYPGDMVAHGFLAAFTTQGSGQYENAVAEGEKAIAIDPDYAIGYQNVAFAHIYQNQIAKAQAVLRRASERKIDTVELSTCRYFIAFLTRNWAGLEREAIQRRTKLIAPGWFEHQESLTLAYQGRLKEAAQLSARAAALSEQSGLRERPALFHGAHAVWSALAGFRIDAKQSAEQALSLYRSRDADFGPAFALALIYDSTPVQKIMADLQKRYPEDTSVRFSYLPALRALDTLNQDHAAEALEIVQAATPYEFAVPGTAFYSGAFFGALYPVYVRGLAYALIGRHREAAAEFQKIVGHSYITLNDPIGPMARLQLAREFLASGDRAKSVDTYKDLLEIWKDADSDVPVVQKARAELAQLR